MSHWSRFDINMFRARVMCASYVRTRPISMSLLCNLLPAELILGNWFTRKSIGCMVVIAINDAKGYTSNDEQVLNCPRLLRRDSWKRIIMRYEVTVATRCTAERYEWLMIYSFVNACRCRLQSKDPQLFIDCSPITSFHEYLEILFAVKNLALDCQLIVSTDGTLWMIGGIDEWGKVAGKTIKWSLRLLEWFCLHERLKASP